MNSENSLLEQVVIRGVVEKYMFALDRLSEELLVDLFTEGAELSYLGGELAMTGGAEFYLAAKAAMRPFRATSHNVHSFLAVVDGDTATADFIAIATLFNETEQVVCVRGIHYLDSLVKQPTGWRIARRVHTPQWQYELPSAKLTLNTTEIAVK